MLSMRDAIRDLADERVDTSTRRLLLAELAIAINHEVRNPLTTVRGFLQFFAGDARFSDQHTELFHLMIGEIDSAVQIIGDLLGLASPAGAGNPTGLKLTPEATSDLLDNHANCSIADPSGSLQQPDGIGI